eukprot:gene12625-12755_t
MQMMLPGAGFGGSQAMQPTMGMIPTPNAGITNSTGMVPIKTDPCGPASNPTMLPNGMVPVVDGMGTAGMGNNGYQQSSSMIPVPGMMGHNALSVMSNGAPVLIKQDNWSATAAHSPSMIPTNSTGGMGGGAMMPVGTGPMMIGSNGPMPTSTSPVNGGYQLDLPAASQPMGGPPSGAGYAPLPGQQQQQVADKDFQKNVADRQQYIQKQQRWLLFLRHCAKCQQSEEDCQFSRSCRVGKELWTHILNCNNPKCPYPRCTSSKDLLKHHQKCQNVNCPICTPVKEYVRRTRNQAGPNGMAGPGGAQPSASMTSNPSQNGMMPVDPGGTAKRARSEGNNQLLSKCFTFDEIRTHLESIAEAAEKTKTAAQMPLNPGDECKVCNLTKLTFEPPCIYCTQCGQRIKRGQIYHCTLLEPGCDFRGFWCHSCLQEHKGDKIPWEGSQLGHVRKADLQKKKNDDEIEEGWVQCDACESWIHMICGLFNKGKNDQNVHYLCPSCLMRGLMDGVRDRIMVRPQAMLESKDLPVNNLSSILEQRVYAALEQDRQERARREGRNVWEVPTAEGLTIRVINNVIKKCEVKPKFYESFRGDGYPEAFIYRQRVVILFQKIDGVDVALYCMYVQEYGNDCPPPNRNCVYLSYIDSVKYFRPEVACSLGNNTSLRTFVYHQILQGYLQFVKGLGFEQMYIWACPPLAGDDYILYCHPSKQKTPRSDRLRAWYHDMLRKARDEGSVCHVGTLWDTFFEGGRDHRLERCTVTAIPYLEGDYWPGEAENLLAQIADAQRNAATGGNTALGRKAGGSKGKRYGAGPATTDEQLLGRLGEILGGNMKEDFMVVHLQEPCSFCRKHVVGGVLHKYMGGNNSLLSRPNANERRFEGLRLESPGVNLPSGPMHHLQICQECYTTEATWVASGAKSRLPGGLSLTDLTQQEYLQK